ncbi:MAG: PLP-dependent aminotransferase family protein [Pseudomonadota bacterium]
MSLSSSDIPIKVEFISENGTLANQLANHIRGMVASGRLVPGDRLPSTRAMASELKLARGTVSSAVELLIAEGLFETRIGAGTFVASEAALLQEPQPAGSSDVVFNDTPTADIDPKISCDVDFRPCRPSLDGFPVQVWRRCLSMAASSPLSPDYGDPLGDIRLRTVISAYLRRARGLVAGAGEIVITNGSVHAMHLLAHVYLSAKSKVFFEDPGYPLARQTFALSGATLEFCDVDQDGILVETLPDQVPASSLVYVTPSHQFPTGGRLSLRRRHELSEWANCHGALIVEDDYDGEYRYDVPPLAPLASFDRTHVVYCGTFSKTMFPGLRLGFAVAPKPIVEAMASYRALAEYAPSAITQVALASFISEGHYERHIHRMRRIYRKKRRFVVDFLESNRLPASFLGLDSGLSGILKFDTNKPIADLCKELQKQKILMPPISRYWVRKPSAVNQAVVGYAAPSLTEIERGLEFVFQTLRQIQPSAVAT